MYDRALSLSEYYIPSKGSETKIRASKSVLSSEQSHGPGMQLIAKAKAFEKKFQFDRALDVYLSLGRNSVGDEDVLCKVSLF